MGILAASVLAGSVLVGSAAGDALAPPAPTFEPGPSDPTNETTAEFTFVAEADLTYDCSLDGAEFTQCVSPQSYSDLSEGAHTFSLRAVSAADGPGDPSSYTWYIDLTPPVLPTDVQEEAVSAAGAVVEFAPTDDHLLAASDCTPASGTTFALGTTEVSCTAQDAAGNPAAGTFNVTVADTTPPTVDPHAQQFAPQDHADGANVVFDPPVTAQDAVDLEPEIVCDPPSGNAFPFGDTLVTCTATDDAGNVSTAMQFTVTVEQGAVPEAPLITGKPPAVTRSTRAAFEFSTSGAPTALQCQLDNGLWEDCTSPREYVGLGEGAHVFAVRVENEVGNLNQSSYGWTVDLTPPGPVTSLRARAAPEKVTLSWAVPIDPDFDRVRVQRQELGEAAWSTVANLGADQSYTDPGLDNEVRYFYRVLALDKAGNISAEALADARPSEVFAPRFEATVRAPVKVNWTTVRRANYYNMQVWRHGRKILSVWPSRSRYAIPNHWRYKGKRRHLTEARHRVYVWPGFGPKAAGRYGRLHGSTAFFGA